MNGYPIVLDVSDRQIVIVGGGNVAVRKTKGLIASGARKIRVVSPKFHEEMSQQVQRVEEVYRREHLDDASLVFAATDVAAVNEQVERDARIIGALVCRADADDAGDFSTPAMHRDGELLITVSSGGPALSAMIRDRIAEKIEPQWAKMATAIREPYRRAGIRPISDSVSGGRSAPWLFRRSKAEPERKLQRA